MKKYNLIVFIVLIFGVSGNCFSMFNSLKSRWFRTRAQKIRKSPIKKTRFYSKKFTPGIVQKQSKSVEPQSVFLSEEQAPISWWAWLTGKKIVKKKEDEIPAWKTIHNQERNPQKRLLSYLWYNSYEQCAKEFINRKSNVDLDKITNLLKEVSVTKITKSITVYASLTQKEALLWLLYTDIIRSRFPDVIKKENIKNSDIIPLKIQEFIKDRLWTPFLWSASEASPLYQATHFGKKIEKNDALDMQRVLAITSVLDNSVHNKKENEKIDLILRAINDYSDNNTYELVSCTLPITKKCSNDDSCLVLSKFQKNGADAFIPNITYDKLEDNKAFGVVCGIGNYSEQEQISKLLHYQDKFLRLQRTDSANYTIGRMALVNIHDTKALYALIKQNAEAKTDRIQD